MKYLVALNNQLLRDFNGDDTSTFVGKVVTYGLRSGLTSEEFEHLVQTLMVVVINCRLNGDRLRYVREVCPLLYNIAADPALSLDIEHGLSFNHFVRRVVSS